METSTHDPQIASEARPNGSAAGHGRKSDALRQRAILELLTGRTFGAAAQNVGVHERTLRQWASEDSEFKAELRAAQQQMFEAGMARLQGMTVRAIDTVGELLGDDQPPTVRLGAARAILEMSSQQFDTVAIRQQLAEIEEHQAEQDRLGKR